jgi:hypothetical protein
MNRTIKEATVKRFHYDSHDQLRTHLADFMSAYNFARRLKTLSGLTPYEYICKIWTSEPERFIIDPIHQMPGLNHLDLVTAASTEYFDIQPSSADLHAPACLFRHCAGGPLPRLRTH